MGDAEKKKADLAAAEAEILQHETEAKLEADKAAIAHAEEGADAVEAKALAYQQAAEEAKHEVEKPAMEAKKLKIDAEMKKADLAAAEAETLQHEIEAKLEVDKA